MSSDYVVVLTTLPGDADAGSFCRSLVEGRVAACANVLPLMESIYRWDGEVQHETERQIVIKTARERVVALWEKLRELHPYEVPEFIVLSIIDGNDAYLRWIGDSTQVEQG